LTETDTPEHALWQCKYHSDENKRLAREISEHLLTLQDPIADSWTAAPHVTLPTMQNMLNSQWPHTFTISRTPVKFKQRKSEPDPDDLEMCLKDDFSLDHDLLRSVNIPGHTGKKPQMPHDDYMTTISFNHHPKMLPIKLSRISGNCMHNSQDHKPHSRPPFVQPS